MPERHRPALLGGLALLVLSSVIGLVAVVIRFRDGLMVTPLTQHVPWGLWIATYIYFIGMSAGSFLLSTLIFVFGVKRLEPVGALALKQALLCLLLGMFLIWVDLGHPERFANVFLHFNPTSVLAWESVLYLLYTAIIIAELLVLLRTAFAELGRGPSRLAPLYRFLSASSGGLDAAWPKRAHAWLLGLALAGIPIAIGVHGGTGALFAVVKSRPTWYTGLFPIVFLVSAVASGGGLLTLLAAVFSRLPPPRKLDVVRTVALLTIGAVCFDLLLITSEVLVVFYGGIPHHAEGWHTILFGPFWWVFWFVQVGLGAVVPIVIVSGRHTGASIGWLAAAGALVVIGVLGVRLNIVIPAQLAPQFPELPDAYHHARFAAGYFPNAIEWLVMMFTFALGAWGALLAWVLFPLRKVELAAAAEQP